MRFKYDLQSVTDTPKILPERERGFLKVIKPFLYMFGLEFKALRNPSAGGLDFLPLNGMPCGDTDELSFCVVRGTRILFMRPDTCNGDAFFSSDQDPGTTPDYIQNKRPVLSPNANFVDWPADLADTFLTSAANAISAISPLLYPGSSHLTISTLAEKASEYSYKICRNLEWQKEKTTETHRKCVRLIVGEGIKNYFEAWHKNGLRRIHPPITTKPAPATQVAASILATGKLSLDLFDKRQNWFLFGGHEERP